MDKSKIARALISDLSALGVAFGISAVILYSTGVDPISAFKSLFLGAFGTTQGLSATFIKMSPLLFTGIGVAIAFKGGLANIGAEGQLYIGALIATAMGLYISGVHPLILIPLIIIASFIFGGLWGFIAGFVKARLQVSEIITSFMLNFVAIYFVNFMVLNPMKGPFPMLPQTDYINKEAILPIIISNTRVHAGILIGITLAIITYIYLEKTSSGFEIVATGSQPKAARWAGISTYKSILLTMFLSGGFAGLAGMVEVTGFQHRLMDGISPGYGYLAIVIALLARNNPIGVIFTSFLFGGLLVGADEMRRIIGIPVGLVYIIEGLVIVCVLIFELLLREKE